MPRRGLFFLSAVAACSSVVGPSPALAQDELCGKCYELSFLKRGRGNPTGTGDDFMFIAEFGINDLKKKGIHDLSQVAFGLRTPNQSRVVGLRAEIVTRTGGTIIPRSSIQFGSGGGHFERRNTQKQAAFAFELDKKGRDAYQQGSVLRIVAISKSKVEKVDLFVAKRLK